MALSPNLSYIRYEFSWQETPEIQNFGFFMRKRESGDYPAPGELAAAQAIADKGVAAFKANIRTTHYAAAVTAARCTAYTLDSDGIHVSEKGVTPFSGGSAWEGAGGIPLPPENSVVMSLYARDPGAFQGSHPGRLRGRVYLPTPETGILTSTGRVASAVVSDWITDWQGWYDDITGAITLAGGSFHVDPIVRSLGGKSGLTAAADELVDWIRFGSIVDTQRRRRDKLPEDYVNHQLS